MERITNSRKAEGSMADKKNSRPRKENSKPSLKAFYAKYREEFTAADLQKYTEVEEGIPAARVIAELAEINRRFSKKRK
jgi:hypothetical protein